MGLVYRVLSVAKWGSRPQIVVFPANSLIRVCRKSTISNPLLSKLLQEPISSVKTALDLEQSLGLKSHAFSCEPLVIALRSSSPVKAQLVLEWKLEKMLKESERDHGRYSELISLCGKVQNVPFAIQVFTLMEGQGVRPTSAVFNSLIFACLSSGNVTTALSLFEIMERSKDCKPNSTTYNAFMSIYSNLGNFKAMEAWSSARKAAGFLHDVQTYESLVAGSIKSKNYDSADRFYEEMLSSGVTPNVPILENVLRGLCEQKKLNKTKEFLKFILDGGWEINGQMVGKLLVFFTELGRVEEFEELLLVLMRSNQDLEVLSRVHCGIIGMYALSDRLDDLEYAVGRMLKQRILFTCPEDVEKVICSYFRRAAYERLDLFLERIQESYKLTKSTYNLLVAGYRRGGLFDKLDLVMKDMKLDGFS